ncbi:hypothetical protein FF38_07033, partial [Lucilia cuprina]
EAILFFNDLMVDLYSGTSDGIVEGVVRILKLNKLSISKLIGIGTDNAAVMTGVNNGVHAKLKSKHNLISLVLVRCVCYSLQLAVVTAAKNCLPDNLECLLRETHNCFVFAKTKDLEKYTNADNPMKILLLADTL